MFEVGKKYILISPFCTGNRQWTTGNIYTVTRSDLTGLKPYFLNNQGLEGQWNFTDILHAKDFFEEVIERKKRIRELPEWF